MNRMTGVTAAFSALVAAAFIAGACGSSSNGSERAARGQAANAATAPAAASVRAVEGEGDPRVAWAFDPGTITIEAGTSVVFSNGGGETHTVTADDGSFDLGNVNAGESKSFTFDRAGTFAYHCSLHPWMTGVVTVTTSDASSTSSGSY